MLRIKSAQYGDIDRAVEDARARYVEDTYRERYMQGDEEFEIWGHIPNSGRYKYLAHDDTFPSHNAAKAFASKYLNEFIEDGYTELWSSVKGSDGESYEKIWEKEEPDIPESPTPMPML